MPITKRPEDPFVKGEAKTVKEALSEAKRINERKLADRLAALGVRY